MKKRLLVRIASATLAGLMTFQTAFVDTNLYVYAKDMMEDVKQADQDETEDISDSGSQQDVSISDSNAEDSIILDFEDLSDQIEIENDEEVATSSNDVIDDESEDEADIFSVDEEVYEETIASDQISSIEENIYVRSNGIEKDYITVSWGITTNVDYDIASFDVYRNNIKVGNIPAADQDEYSYTDKNLDITKTYIYQIVALDSEGTYVGKSNERELFFADDLVLPSSVGSLILDEDMVFNNIKVNGSENIIDLNGHKLTVFGDITSKYSLKINVNGGYLECNNLINPKSNSMYLIMENDEDYVLINGDFSYSYPSTMPKKGTLEIKGDMIDTTNSSNHAERDNTFIFSGYKRQYVSCNNYYALANVTELKNTSEDGVVFNVPLYSNEFKYVDGASWCIEGFETERGWKLEENQEINEDLYISGGGLDLNGHTLTVNGDFYILSGVINVNNGQLIIKGDYYNACLYKDRTIMSDYNSNAYLEMVNPNDYVCIYGDYYARSGIDTTNHFTNGVLEIKGNIDLDMPHWYSYDDMHYFVSSNDFVLKLSGDVPQNYKIDDAYYNHIANVEFDNHSYSGIYLNNDMYVTGSFTDKSRGFYGSRVNLAENASLKGEHIKGSIGIYNNAPVSIDADTVIDSGSSVYFYDLTLNADLTVKNSLSIYGDLKLNGHKLIVDGSLNMYSGSSLVMNNESDYLCVKGLFDYSTDKELGDTCSAGLVELKGDFKCNSKFNPAGTNTFSICGDSFQTITMDSAKVSSFNNLLVDNTSGVDIYAPNGIKYNSIDNKSNSSFVSVKPTVSTADNKLTEDKIIEGDYVIDGGLDLNGYTLTVTGNVIHKSGTLSLNGGTLDVKGDFTVVDNNTSNKSNINMSSSIIKVGGDFSFDASLYLSLSGTLYVAGNIVQKDNDSKINSVSWGGVSLVLNGKGKQTISLLQSKDSHSIGNFKVLNTSNENIEFVTPVYLNGTVNDGGKKIVGPIIFGSRVNIENDGYHGDVILNSSYSNKLVVNGEVYVKDNSTISNEFIVNGNLYFDGGNITLATAGSVTVNGDIEYNKGDFTSTSAIKNVNVNGNIHVNNAGCVTWKNITMNLTGDLLVTDGQKNPDATYFACSTATLNLCGDKKQTVELIGNNDIIGTIVINNSSAEGVYAPYGLRTNVLKNNSGALVVDNTGSLPSGLVLTEDLVLDGDCSFAVGNINLNGYTLTINGNFTHVGGKITFGAGKLVVNGDYITLAEKDGKILKSGILDMNTSDSYFLVNGDFIYQTEAVNRIYRGTIEVTGDFIDKTGKLSFDSYVTVIFSGKEKQNVRFENVDDFTSTSAGLYNVTIINKSEEGVVFDSCVPVKGKLITNGNNVNGTVLLTASASSMLAENYFSGNVIILGGKNLSDPISVGGDLSLLKQGNSYTTPTLNKAVTVGGNVYIESGINIYNQLKCAGDFKCNSSVYAYNEGSVLYVGGDLDVLSGTMREVHLNGANAQHVTLGDYARFTTLVLENISKDGIYFNTEDAHATTFIDNGVPVHYSQTSIEDNDNEWILEEDVEINETLNITDKTVDLNGHSLIVKGDLFLDNSELKINGGYLEVTGDFNIYHPVIDESGKVIAKGKTNAILYMMANEDKVFVKGDWNVKVNNWNNSNFVGGVFEIQGDINGDFSSSSISSYTKDSELEFHFTGDKSQNITNEYNNDTIYMAKVVVENKNAGRVYFDRILYVYRALVDEDHRLNPNTFVNYNPSVDLSNVNANIYVSWIDSDIDTIGKLYFVNWSSPVDFKGHKIHARAAVIPGKINLNGGSLIIDEDVNLMSFIIMNKPSDYFEVGGKLLISNLVSDDGTNYTDGTILVKGDIKQNTSAAYTPFISTGENVLILPGKDDEQIQKVYFTSDECKINKLVLYKSIENYQFTPELDTLCDDVVYGSESGEVTAPEAPKNLKGEAATSNAVSLSWDASENVYAYEIYRNGVLVGSSISNEFKDGGLTPSTEYQYKVRIIDTQRNKSEFSEEISVISGEDTIAPSKVSGVSVEYTNASSICIRWNYGADNVGVVKYNVYRNDTSTLVGEVDSQSSYGSYFYFADTELSKNTMYTYYVTAVDAAGNESDASIGVNGYCYEITMDRWYSPSSSVSVVGGDAVSLRYYCDRNYTSYLAAYEYVAKYEYKGTDGEWILIRDNVPQTKTSNNAYELYFDTAWYLKNVEDGTYDVRITVSDKLGNEKAVTRRLVVDKTAPAKCEELSAVCTDGVVLLKWIASDSVDVKSYKIYRSMRVDGAKLLMGTSNTNSYSDLTGISDETYYYWVSAVDSVGQEGELSDVASVLVKSDTVDPAVTSIDCANKRINGKINIKATGTDNKGIKTMNLYYRTDEDSDWILAVENKQCTSNATTFTFDTKTVADGIIYFKVTAKDAAGNSSETEGKSKQVSATIDNTGISKVKVTSVEALATSVTITWDDVPDDDLAYFEVLSVVNGSYKRVETNIKSLGYVITGLKPETEYRYVVVGYDDLGNTGVVSDVVVVRTQKDVNPPVVREFGPADEYIKNNINITVKAIDDAELGNAVFEYSQNKDDWTQFAEVRLGRGYKEYTYYSSLDISKLNDGYVYVRVYVYDVAENESHNAAGDPVENYFIIDRTAPEKVSEFTATGQPGYIELNWEYDIQDDFYAYEISRKKVSDSAYSVIAVVTSADTTMYRDTKVDSTNAYEYRIRVVDKAVNYGAYSDSVLAQSINDTVKPEVIAVSPADFSLVPAKVNIKANIQDYSLLANAEISYKSADDESDLWTNICSEDLNDNIAIVETVWDTTGLESGDYIIKVVATDSEGNVSDDKLMHYTVDNVLPDSVILSASAGEGCNTLSWTECESEDFKQYKIYRKKAGTADYNWTKVLTANKFEDTSVNADSTYVYMVAACDEAGNEANSNTVTVTPKEGKDRTNPIAMTSENYSARVGSEIRFDASSSRDEGSGIAKYIWNFGNGDSLNGMIVNYAYNKIGVYNGSLTVEDYAGNRSTVSFVVTIVDKTTGVTQLTICNSDGNVIYKLGGSYVYIENIETGEGANYNADSNGNLFVALNPGFYTVSAYQTGYMPQTFNLSISKGDNIKQELYLEKGEIVTGTLITTRLTLEEMKRLGIDTSVEENWYKKTVKLVITIPGEARTRTIWVDNIKEGKTVFVPGNGSGSGSGGSSARDGYYVTVTDYTDTKVIVVYRTTSYLKKMYDVELNVTNNAETGSIFDIEDAMATLQMPSGLSLVKLDKPQTVNVDFGVLRAGETKNAHWFIKADEPGKYRLAALFTGNLQPFGAEVNTVIEADNDLNISEEEDNTFDDPGFITTDEYKSKTLYIRNKQGRYIKGAIVTLLDNNTGKKSQTITNSNGKAVVHVNKNEKRRFTLKVTHDKYKPYVNEDFVFKYPSTGITLYKEGENDDSQSIRLNDVLLSGVSAKKDKLYINVLDKKDYELDYSFASKINSYKLYIINTYGKKRTISEISNMEPTAHFIDNLTVDQFVNPSGGYYEGQLMIDIGDKSGNKATYELNIYSISDLFGNVSIDIDGKYDTAKKNLLVDSYTIYQYKKTTDEVSSLQSPWCVSKYNEKGYELKNCTITVSPLEGLSDLVDSYELVHGNDRYTADAYNKFHLNVADLNQKYTMTLVGKKNGVAVESKQLNVIVKEKEIPLAQYKIEMFDSNGVQLTLPSAFKYFGGPNISFSNGNDCSIFGTPYYDIDNNLHIKYSFSIGASSEEEFVGFKKQREGVPSSALKLIVTGELIDYADSDTCTGSISVSVALGYGVTVPVFTSGSVQVSLTGSSEQKGTIIVQLDENRQKQMELVMTSIIKLYLEVYYAVVGTPGLFSAGVYGGVNLELYMLKKNMLSLYAPYKLAYSGEVGIRGEVFGLQANVIIVNADKNRQEKVLDDDLNSIANRINNPTAASSEFVSVDSEEDALFDASSYKYNEADNRPSVWVGDGSNNMVNGYSVVQKDAAYSADSKLVNVNGKTIMFFDATVSGYDVANNKRVMYSVMNADGSFAEPVVLSDSNRSQYDYDVSVNGKDVYVVFKEAKEELSTEMNLLDTSKKMELRAVRLNTDTFDVSKLGSYITDNDIMEAGCNITYADDQVYVVWYENSEDDVFGMTGTNKFRYSVYDGTDNAWLAAEDIATTDQCVDSCDVGVLSGEVCVAYTGNYKGHVVNIGTKINTDIQSSAANMIFTNMGTTPVLTWYSDGQIYKKAAGAEESVMVPDINVNASLYSLVNDSQGHSSVIFTRTVENKGSMFVVDYDESINQYGKATEVLALDENQYIEKPDGAYVNGNLAIAFNRTYNKLENGEMSDVITSDLCFTAVSKDALLEISDVKFDSEKVVPGADVDVSFALVNNGLVAISKDDATVTIIDRNDEVVYTGSLADNLVAGDVCVYTATIKMPYTLSLEKYKIVIGYAGKEEVKEFELGHADLAVTGVLELHNGEYSVVAKIRNYGVATANGKVTFYDKTNNNAVLESVAFDEVIYDELVEVEHVLDASIFENTDSHYIGVKIESDCEQLNYLNDQSEVLIPGIDSRKLYSVVFDYGIANKIADSVYAFENDTVVLPVAPSVDGYTFAGWYRSTGEEFTSSTPVTENIMVTARYVEDQAKPDPTPAPTPTPDPQPTPDPTPDVPTVDPTVNPFDGYANKVFVGEKKDISGLFANVVKPEGQKLYYRIVDAPVKKMASVSNKGMFLPKKPGKVSVELYYVEKKVGENGKKTKVKTPLSKVEISILKLGVNESAITATYSGKTVDLNEMMVFNDGTKTVSGNSIIPDIVKDGMTVTYASSNKKVATVDEKGVITVGDKSGKSTIMIKLVTPNKRKINIKVKLTVKIPAFAKKAYSVKVGKTVKTKMKNLVDSNKTGIVYAIVDTNIATVDSATGVITGVSIGETEIIATVEGRQYRSTVKVK